MEPAIFIGQPKMSMFYFFCVTAKIDFVRQRTISARLRTTGVRKRTVDQPHFPQTLSCIGFAYWHTS